jgi:predicted transcriptional regulator
MTAIRDSERMIRTDEAILEELREHRLEYMALVANRRGLHLTYAKERCKILERRGFVEQTTDEVTYRITEKGESYLDAVAGGMTDYSPGELDSSGEADEP